jgi:L-lysine 6-transaminase
MSNMSIKRNRKINTTNITFHNILVDLEKSSGSYVYDINTKRYYLDFFGMYSSLPLGYNHSCFNTRDFKKDIEIVSKVKVTNCEMSTPQLNSFVDKFSNFAIPEDFSALHFSCTGGLAVEAGIKAAFYHKSRGKSIKHLKCASLSNGFHGITSYGNFLTERRGPAGKRLSGFPDIGWPKFSTHEELEGLLKFDKDIGAVILEPIQCTFGDIHISSEFLNKIRKITLKYNVPLIFDEVQTGFCSTGTVWYFQKLSWSPDIVIFGKKSQVCGIFVKNNFDQIFEKSQAGRMCITFDGDLVDMVRCSHIIDTIQRDNLLTNVLERESQFREELSCIKKIENIRSSGLLFAFDLPDTNSRDTFVKNLRNIGMICNPTSERSVRLRPSLCVSSRDISQASSLIKEAIYEN